MTNSLNLITGLDCRQTERRVRTSGPVKSRSVRKDGVTVAACVRERKLPTQLILLDSGSNPEHLAQGLAAGIAGYLLTSSTPEELSLAIRTVVKGDVYIASSMQRHLLLGNDERERFRAPPLLNAVQRRVLRMLVDGKTSKEIGNEMHIEWRQVDRLRLRMMKQFDVPNVAALVRYALEHHLVLLKNQSCPAAGAWRQIDIKAGGLNRSTQHLT